MKYSVVLLVAALVAMVGSAWAWEATEEASYKYLKTLDEQDAFTPFSTIGSGPAVHDSVDSGVWFDNPTSLIKSAGEIENNFWTKQGYVHDGTMPVNVNNPGDTFQKLTQSGSIKMALESKDLADTDPELSIDIAKAQTYEITGHFDNVEAHFSDTAQAGVLNFPALDGTSVVLHEASPVDYCLGTSNFGRVEATGPDVEITSATMGTISQSSLDAFNPVAGAFDRAILDTKALGFAEGTGVAKAGASNFLESEFVVESGSWWTNAFL